MPHNLSKKVRLSFIIRHRLVITAVMLLLLIIPVLSAETLNESQRMEVLKTVNTAKKAFLSKDFDTFVGVLHPEMVRAMGGKEKLAQLIKAEDAKNAAAGLVIESLEMVPAAELYTGTDYRLAFVTSKMIVKIADVRTQSDSFYIAFSSIQGGPWYLIDGTRLSQAQFRSAFHGFPDDLKLPPVAKKTL